MKTIIQKTITAITLIASLLLAAANTSAETTITYLINDGLGSPIAAMDEQGAVIWRKDYQPYGGEYTLDPAATEERIGFTGHVHDTGTGLTYMGARYYDPVAGRFMAADPVGFDESNPMSFSRYGYANSNPYKYVDPDGRTPIDSLVVLLYPAGKAFGGLAAYAQGVITGDQALVNNVNAGLASDRNENIGALGLAATVFFLPPGAGSLEKGGAVARGIKGLETRGVRPASGERTIQGQVDAATQAGNPTIQRGGQDLFRLRSSGHGQSSATATPQNVRNVTPSGRVFTGKGPDRAVTQRDIRELYKAQTGQGTNIIRTRSGR